LLRFLFSLIGITPSFHGIKKGLNLSLKTWSQKKDFYICRSENEDIDN